jgi:hypothetical protein
MASHTLLWGFGEPVLSVLRSDWASLRCGNTVPIKPAKRIPLDQQCRLAGMTTAEPRSRVPYLDWPPGQQSFSNDARDAFLGQKGKHCCCPVAKQTNY